MRNKRGVAYVALGSSPDVARMLHAEDAGGGAVEVGQQDGFGVFQEALPGAAFFGSQRVGAEGETFEPGVDLGVEVEGDSCRWRRPGSSCRQLAELGVEVLEEVEHVPAVLVGHVEEVAVVDDEQPGRRVAGMRG